MHGLGLFIRLNIYVAHMLYACPFSNNTEVPTDIKQNKGFISLNTYTTVFSWGTLN